jgi:hypothetical protein
LFCMSLSQSNKNDEYARDNGPAMAMTMDRGWSSQIVVIGSSGGDVSDAERTLQKVWGLTSISFQAEFVSHNNVSLTEYSVPTN